MKKSFSVLIALILVISLTLAMAAPALADDTGPRYPGTVTTVAESPYDDVDWINVALVTDYDGSYASVLGLDPGQYSYVLRATNFGFSIPADATIDGIEVQVRRLSSSEGTSIQDAVVQLTKDGSTRVGTNGFSVSNWGTDPFTVFYGWAEEKWGTTWTAAEINAETFGVHFAVQNADESDPRNGQVDFIRITVYYTEPSSPVGGTGHLVNRLALLAPWLALAAVIAGAAVFTRRRLTQS